MRSNSNSMSRSMSLSRTVSSDRSMSIDDNRDHSRVNGNIVEQKSGESSRKVRRVSRSSSGSSSFSSGSFENYKNYKNFKRSKYSRSSSRSLTSSRSRSSSVSRSRSRNYRRRKSYSSYSSSSSRSRTRSRSRNITRSRADRRSYSPDRRVRRTRNGYERRFRGENRGRFKQKPRTNGLKRLEKENKEVDRTKNTPFLLKVLAPSSDGNEGNEELHVYVWKDTTLRDLVNLIKDISPPTRNKVSNWTFSTNFGDVSVELGSVHCFKPNTREDNRTLESLKFQIGNVMNLKFN